MDKTNAPTNRTSARAPPALNPEQLALTQPYKEFVATGLISSIKVEFTGITQSVSVTLGSHVPVPDGSPREGIAPGMAKKIITDSGLWSPRAPKNKSGDKKEVEPPKRSLVKADFKLDDKKFAERVSSVARELGSSTARGRIGSLRFMVKGVDTFEKWWGRAPSPAKARLLMDGKHHAELEGDEAKRIAALPCPFRGSDAVPTPTEEEQANGAN